MSQNTERSAGNDAPPPTVPNLQIEALMGEMRRMLREECEQIHERLDRVEEGTQRRPRRNRVYQREDENEGDLEGVDLMMSLIGCRRVTIGGMVGIEKIGTR